MTQWGLDTLFNPAKRHMDDEKRRLQSTREEAGDSSGGKRIDLASGKVVIRRDDSSDDEPGTDGNAGTNGTDGTDGTDARTDRAGSSHKGRHSAAKGPAKGHGAKSAKPEPSAAAVRAAKRRGRTV